MTMFRLFARYMRHYQKQVVLVLVFVIIQAVCQLWLPKIMSAIVDKGVATGDFAYIIRQGGLMLLLSLVAVVTVAGSANYSAYVTARFSSFIRRDMFLKTLQFSQTDFSRFGLSTLLSRATQDATQMQTVVINSLRSLILIPITGLGALIFALRINGLLTAIVLVAFASTLVLIRQSITRSKPLFQQSQKNTDRVNMLVNEKLKGMRTIRAFNRQEYEDEKFTAANEAQTQQIIRANFAINYLAPAIQVVLNLATVLVLWAGAFQLEAGHLLIGQLMQFIAYITMFMLTITVVMILLTALPKIEVCAARVSELLDAEVSIASPKNPQPLQGGSGGIRFENVSFGYAQAESPVLKNISFYAPPGKTTAIIGATGSGKSTLVNLVLRLYDCTEGAVQVDGVDIKECNLEALRALISYAPQKSVLLAKSIRDNLRVANQTASDEEIWHALRLAAAEEFVKTHEEGLDYQLAQGGKNLSGGQKQRLSIARALLRKSSIYLFDDCFSALDFKTDLLVRRAIAEEYRGKTILIIAQRISTIKNADNILVLSEGAIAAQGTHAQLLESCEIYREILATQTDREGEADYA